MEQSKPDYDVVIVGAGAAGIGMALTLQKIPGLNFIVLDSGRIGESFHRWPAQTRFITPSFHSNPFGLADLNSITAASSPAVFANAEHLSGPQYAAYLASLASQHKVPVQTHCKVHHVSADKAQGFLLETANGQMRSRFLIWATGEFQFPDLTPFPGSNYCPHYAQVSDWSDFRTGHYTVIGGYESGIDASVNLIKSGCDVRLLVKQTSWDSHNSDDPSICLSPYTRERLQEALLSERLDVCFDVDVTQVAANEDGQFRITARDGRHWQTTQAPILATGFINGGGARQIAELWAWSDEGDLLVSEADESTRTPGLFLVGPQLRQEERIYCFIYKFRQRFAALGISLAQCLQLDARGLQGDNMPWGPFGNNECCGDCEC